MGVVVVTPTPERWRGDHAAAAFVVVVVGPFRFDARDARDAHDGAARRSALRVVASARADGRRSFRPRPHAWCDRHPVVAVPSRDGERGAARTTIFTIIIIIIVVVVVVGIVLFVVIGIVVVVVVVVVVGLASWSSNSNVVPSHRESSFRPGQGTAASWTGSW